ncbi:MAG: alpha/beta fold hydrolase, partial [Leeuwenhoekiella sp.]
MPVIPSSYKAKGAFKNPHFSTIYSAKIRHVSGVIQTRKRVFLSDGDFIDIDWSYAKTGKKASKVAVLFHGLEGNAHRPYMLATAKTLNKNGYDCVAVNLRGCSGSMNATYRSYHSGATEDVEAIIDYLIEEHTYPSIYLVGFSLGGNLILKYLGEKSLKPSNITAAVAVSTPVHLYGSMLRLSQFENRIYHWSFLKDLKKKLKIKIAQFPENVTQADLKKIINLQAFDEVYTAPANGFKDALDYYTKSSSLDYLP